MVRLGTGKYDGDNLPQGPRAALFKQILPGAQPLLEVLQEIAERRNKTVPQVSCTTHCLSVVLGLPVHAKNGL